MLFVKIKQYFLKIFTSDYLIIFLNLFNSFNIAHSLFKTNFLLGIILFFCLSYSLNVGLILTYQNYLAKTTKIEWLQKNLSRRESLAYYLIKNPYLSSELQVKFLHNIEYCHLTMTEHPNLSFAAQQILIQNNSSWFGLAANPKLIIKYQEIIAESDNIADRFKLFTNPNLDSKLFINLFLEFKNDLDILKERKITLKYNNPKTQELLEKSLLLI